MKLREKRLKDKGWTDEEISHAKGVLAQADRNKSHMKKLTEEVILWVFLSLVAAGSVVGAWIAQPFFLILSTGEALFALGMIGVLFGLFAGWIVGELEELESHHHAFMTISIPLVAVISSIVLSNRVTQIMAASPAFNTLQHNPYLLALTYALATIIPYSIILYVEKKRYEA